MYRITPDEVVHDQLEHLPRAALAGYAEVLAVLQVAPERGLPYNDANPDGPMRQFAFGPDGRGLVTYLVLQPEGEVHVLLVDWLA